MVLGRHSLPQEWQASLDLTLSDSGLNASIIRVDDGNMADIAAALGARTSWSAQELSVMLEANQTTVGIGLIILAVVIIVAVLPISVWNLKLARARADAKSKSAFKLPRTTFSPIPSDESELPQKSPPKLEMVTVNDDGADMSMSRHLSPFPAARNEHRK